MAKIYVSSTWLDLKDCREAVRRALRSMGHEDIAMEYYTAGVERPVDQCLKDVADADVYVGIFAWRYGSIPKGYDKSVTELEYRKAVELGKPRLLFVVDDKTPWPMNLVELGTENGQRLQLLRKDVLDDRIVGWFTNEVDLSREVVSAVSGLEKDHPEIFPITRPAASIESQSTITPQDMETYRNAIRKRYRVLNLESLTPPEKEEYRRIQLAQVFVEQHVREEVPPLELSREIKAKLASEDGIPWRELPADEMLEELNRARSRYTESPRQPELDAVSRHKCCVILGDPGAGKSTLARYLLLSLLDDNDTLPIFIELRFWIAAVEEGHCKDFFGYMSHLAGTEHCSFTEEAMKGYMKNGGRVLFIFDGLDEIFKPLQRENAARQIAGIAAAYPDARILVTSRIVGYNRKILDDADFRLFTLQNLEKEQVEVFTGKWYNLAIPDNPEDAEAHRRRILKGFEDSPSIRQLAGNPMLLTILAIIGKHRELPRERWRLYSFAAEVLLENWDVRRHLDNSPGMNFELEDKKELLRTLAWHMQGGVGGEAGNYIYKDTLQSIIVEYLDTHTHFPGQDSRRLSRDMIRQLQERNFILSCYGGGIFGFVHRAFLESFCADCIVRRFEKTRKYSIEDINEKIYSEHWNEESWHEVLRLVCSMLDTRWVMKIIGHLADLKTVDDDKPWNLALAFQCMGEVRNPGDLGEVPGRVVEVLFGLIGRSVDDSSFLDFLGSHIVAPIMNLQNSEPMIDAQKLNRLIDGLLIKLLNLPESGIMFIRGYQSIGIMIACLGNGHSNIRERLYSMSTDTRSVFIRIIALAGIIQGYREEEGTLPMLRDRAINDNHEDVRQAAVDALAEHYREEEGTLPMLRDRAINDNNQWVRRAAVQALAKYYREEEGTLPMLRDRAINDNHEDVRQAAVEALAEHYRYREEEGTLPLLRDRAINDNHEDVRRAAIKALAEHYREEEGTLPMLRDWAINDNHEEGAPGGGTVALAEVLPGGRDHPADASRPDHQ